jgi:hypothetical protein
MLTLEKPSKLPFPTLLFLNSRDLWPLLKNKMVEETVDLPLVVLVSGIWYIINFFSYTVKKSCGGRVQSSITHNDPTFKPLPFTIDYLVQGNPTNTDTVTISSVILVGFANWRILDPIYRSSSKRF